MKNVIRNLRKYPILPHKKIVGVKLDTFIILYPKVKKKVIIQFLLLKVKLSNGITPNYSVHGEKFISKLNFFYKKIHYFYSDAGTHSKCRIFTVLNSTF